MTAPAVDPSTLALVWAGMSGIGLGATLLMAIAAWWKK